MKHFPNPKRTVTAMLAVAMLASLASCGGDAPASDTTAAPHCRTLSLQLAGAKPVAATASMDRSLA